MKFGQLIAILFTLLVMQAGPLCAQSIEKLVMPGPVATPHAKTEEDCNVCHAPFSQERQPALCLECHKEVKADLAANAGFHGRNENVRSRECRSCHTEHRGRAFDIVGLNVGTFDHSLTDFALDNAHSKLACGACHVSGKKFRVAPQECIACHADDDMHQEGMGKDCASCHTTDRWFETKFDHGKTEFALTGKHDKIQCAACHVDTRYKETPKTCVACHALSDVHAGVYGQVCKDCHTATAWNQAEFDHARTLFPLKGEHGKAECTACHAATQKTAKLSTECIDCHLVEDVHKGSNGKNCKSCHSESDWKVSSFDHNKETEFSLLSAHARLDCVACHLPGVDAREAETTCIGCHSADDPHNDQLGRQCGTCHAEVAWRADVRFDHDLTAFQLLGLHVAAPCEACHASNAFQDAETKCIECHRSDDIHKDTLGTECETCHNPNGWPYWQFDHAVATDYPLAGAHAELACISCHATGTPADTPTECVDCHLADDVHNGRFGTQCELCHTTDEFNP